MNPISKLFRKSTELSTVPAAPIPQEAKKAGETYQNWGKRICATVSGNSIALAAFLHNVYNYIYKEQAGTVTFQEEMQRNIQIEIKQSQNNIDFSNQQINDHFQQIAANDDRIQELTAEKNKVAVEGRKANPAAKAKLILGSVILVPLTCYLFLFYSSTFFSAFLAGKNAIKDAAGAMFNPHCFEIAWGSNIATFFFMMCFPVIFLGLGFSLHFFSIEKGKAKYLKMAAIVLVTFAFDCILAYKIGDRIHQYMVNQDLIPDSEYTITMAIHDPNTWAVIFCGFIAYIIWGIVFDQSMDAYGALDQRAIELQAINDRINKLEESNKDEQKEIQSLHTRINDLQNKIAALTSQLNNKIFIDTNAIKTEMGNFFSGWIAQMGFLGCSSTEQAEARDTYGKTIETLFKE
ncbi:MAG: hypothetical protein IJ710_05365 [Prevotella sp.]|nr:hypothetical protein [Prevotella sp.]